jgi:molecular chaperone GrpE
MGEGGDERHPDTRERAQGERPHDEGGQGGSVEEGDPRTRVKVTDKRRFRPGESDEPAGSTGLPEASEAEVADEAGPGEELERARKEASEYLDHLRRLKAEFENYRKRVLREQTQAIELASEGLIARLLEVLDEFELALVAAEQKPDFEKFRQGVEMVFAKLADILRTEGLERIEAKGKPFDPELHEALLQTGQDEGEPYVVDVLRSGYTLRGKVVRPAGVKVGRR